MIRQKITLPDYDNWTIYAYYATTRYAVDEIMERLWEIGMDANNARQAFENLSMGNLNTGLCYSNYSMSKSVLVIALTSSPAEFINSWHHELEHLESHIGKVFNLDPTGEDIAYLSGELAMEMYPRIKHLICDCCRHK
jgi:hypothetical protein